MHTTIHSDDAADLFIEAGDRWYRHDTICHIHWHRDPSGAITGAAAWTMTHETPLYLAASDARALHQALHPLVRAQAGSLDEQLTRARINRADADAALPTSDQRRP